MKAKVFCEQCNQPGEAYNQSGKICIPCYKSNRREYYHRKRAESNGGMEGFSSLSQLWLSKPTFMEVVI